MSHQTPLMTPHQKAGATATSMQAPVAAVAPPQAAPAAMAQATVASLWTSLPSPRCLAIVLAMVERSKAMLLTSSSKTVTGLGMVTGMVNQARMAALGQSRQRRQCPLLATRCNKLLRRKVSTLHPGQSRPTGVDDAGHSGIAAVSNSSVIASMKVLVRKICQSGQCVCMHLPYVAPHA